MIYRTSKLHPHTHMIKINDCWFETTQQHILQQFESMSELWLMINSRNQQFILVTKHNSFWDDINECWYFSVSCTKIVFLLTHHRKFTKGKPTKNVIYWDTNYIALYILVIVNVSISSVVRMSVFVSINHMVYIKWINHGHSLNFQMKKQA